MFLRLNGREERMMNSLFFALITLFGWGTWLAPSQKVIFPNQQIKTLYVVATNLAIATVVYIQNALDLSLVEISQIHLSPNSE